ncbi:MAG: putative extracellular nuclease [Alteromonadaceae bacterium]|jgi:predicted extracellular nuclease
MIKIQLKVVILALGGVSALNLTACHSPASNAFVAGNATKITHSAECSQPVTLISQIQGYSHSSPMVGQAVTVQALVSAFTPGMGGYYLLEEMADIDKSADSSEGVFVFDKTHQPAPGDKVTLSATVAEHKGLTQLTNVTALSVCSQGHALKAHIVKLPFSHKNQLEAYEGMLVEFPQKLTLSDNYNFTRFGQMMFSNGRLFQPSNVAMPGAAANKIEAANQLNQLIVDDLSTQKNPPLTFDVNHLYRTGNTVKGIKGVVHYAFGHYLLEPTTPLNMVAENKRQSKPPISELGQLRVASFNVLNYFNGQGSEKTFPTPRGAHTKAEFVRQNAKIIAAMKVINADIFGLMEIENDGYGPHSAIAELTQNLTKASGANYAFVKPQSDKLGTDVIAVGMIYNADKIALVGDAATLSVPPFNGKSRQPLAQTFKHRDSGDDFTLVVNHFKSKRCPKDKNSLNADQGDSQGCWNLSRTMAAKKLLKWLDSAPTGSNDKDVLIIGDLNANAKEQPVTTLIAGGYHNMIEKFQGKDAYSFVYRGLAGYLDHALASTTLATKVVDASDWHINADEMRSTDYNLENKSLQQQNELFRPDPFRSSDHDPMIIEISPR